MLLSIAIPSYNRPNTLIELLSSIDFISDDIEVVICEDNSPKKIEIREAITRITEQSPLTIRYYENPKNLGYDENLWELIRHSSGKFIVYMGDDDEFIPGSLEKFYEFLKRNKQLGYVLKSHITIYRNNSKEYFNYYPETVYFEKGENSIIELFRKSILISGFCIRKEDLMNYYTTKLTGTLLTQLYLLSIQCLKYPSAYFAIPLTVQDENKNTIPYFGSSENEKGLYVPGENSVNGSLNFMNKYNQVLDLIDSTHTIQIKKKIKLNMSKYSYPILAIQRNKGVKVFTKYTIQLCKIGYNSSIYFYFYYLSLLILEKRNCDNVIIFLKSKLKSTPRL